MNESDEPRNVSAVSDETLVNNGLNALFYSQPMTVTEALDAAEPAPDGTRLAETIPNGDVVAVKTPAGVYVRRKGRLLAVRRSRLHLDGAGFYSNVYELMKPDGPPFAVETESGPRGR